MARRERYREAAFAIARYLAERQLPDGGFPGPDNYGVASALWLWSQFGAEFARQMGRAWQHLKDRPPETYGEFNCYALLHCRERFGVEPVNALLRRIRLAGRHSANWMLLRALCRSLPGPHCAPLRGALGARLALARYLRKGLIADRPGVRSLGYHAFCGVLLCDLWDARGWTWAGQAAAQAAQFLKRFVLPNGDTLYVGRGQAQIFGYGALLCLLERAYYLTADPDLPDLADRVFDWLRSFQRPDGSFPLVLSRSETPEPWLPDPDRPGWYRYNRYADYLPFLGCMLLKAEDCVLPPVGDIPPPVFHPDFRVWRQDRYTAVLSRPGGSSTNDLPFPYVCVSGESIFPCYGVEGPSAPPESVPLPFGLLSDGRPYGFRDRLTYRLSDDGLVGWSARAVHRRRFEFAEHGFTCRDEIVFRRACSFRSFTAANFLFRTLQATREGDFQTWRHGARAVISLSPDAVIHPHAAVTAAGQLVALRHTREPMSVARGDRLSVELRVRFL